MRTQPPEPRRGTWSAWNFATLWMTGFHSVPGYVFVIGLLATTHGLGNTLAGTVIGGTVLSVVAVLSGCLGYRLDAAFPESIRILYGPSAARVAAALRGAVAIAWYGIQTFLAAVMITSCLAALLGRPESSESTEYLGMTGTQWAVFAVLSVVQVAVLTAGGSAVRRMADLAGPIVWLCLLAVIALHHAEIADTLVVTPPQSTGSVAIAAVLTIAFLGGPAVNYADFGRYARSPRALVIGTTVGIIANAAGFVVVAAAIDAAIPASGGEPFSRIIASSPVAAGLLLTAVLTLCTVGANVVLNFVSATNDLGAIVGQSVSNRTVVAAVGLAAAASVPGVWYSDASRVMQFVSVAGSALAPLAGIVVASAWRTRNASRSWITRAPTAFWTALCTGLAAEGFTWIATGTVGDLAWPAGAATATVAALLVTRTPSIPAHEEPAMTVTTRVRTSYLRTTAFTDADPIDTAVRLAREFDSAAPYVVYEDADTIKFASGILSEILVDRSHVHIRTPSSRRSVAWANSPLPTVTDALAELDIEDWRAYGTADFELALAIANVGFAAPSAPLLHLFVPTSEAVLHRSGSVELRSIDATGIDRFRTLLDARDDLGTTVPRGLDENDLRYATDRDSYRGSVRTAVDAIRAGELDKVILSRRVEVSDTIDIPESFRSGRRHNTPARSFLLHLDGRRAAGFSPEIVMTSDRDSRVGTQPLAGTRARGTDSETRSLGEDLVSDPKEVFEHAISVKLAYEELASVCTPGSVSVPEFMITKHRGTVQHLGSHVSGHLSSDVSPWDAFEVLFPSITASGIPKRSAFEQISSLESGNRGLYSGAVLTVDSTGELDAALVLRTVFQQDGRTWIQAGAGIVSASTEERESTETIEKLQSVSRHLVALAPGRSTAPAPSLLPTA